MEDAMNIDELAARLGTTKQVIYTMRYSKQGPPAFRVGRELRWRPSDVDEWIASRLDAGESTQHLHGGGPRRKKVS